MSWFKLLLRTLIYHRATNLTIVLGCAVGSAILTGALLVGDSMRGSLRTISLERLGAIDLAAVTTRFFHYDLSERLENAKVNGNEFQRSAAIIMIRGSLRTQGGEIVSRVNLIGTTADFWSFFPAIPSATPLQQLTCMNERLAEIAGMKNNDSFFVQVEKVSPIPREGLLGDRSTDKTLISLPAKIDKIIPNRSAGRFSLATSQQVPLNLYLPIDVLSKAIGQPGRANALLVSIGNQQPIVAMESLQRMFKTTMSLDDFGITVRPSAAFNYIAVDSNRQIIDSAVQQALARVWQVEPTSNTAILTHLANSIQANGKSIPYSVVSSFQTSALPWFTDLKVEPQKFDFGLNDVILNRWAAEELGAKVGDTVTMEYYTMGSDGNLRTEKTNFTLKGIAKMEGLALDRDFSPAYPGITDTKRLSDWDPPFPIDLKKMRKKDEDYWSLYKTAPKAFVNYETARRLWSTRFGNMTSARSTIGQPASLTKYSEVFAHRVLEMLAMSDCGLYLQTVKEDSLQASSGSTDFDQLFLAFSSFLILSAALLVGLLFRLNLERRASEWGILLATGWTATSIRLLASAEGLLLASIGSLLGLGAASLYAKAMVYSLTTWWQSAVQTSFLEYHWSARSFAIGWAGAVAVAEIAIIWASWRTGSTPIVRMLGKGFSFDQAWSKRRRTLSFFLAILGILGGIGLITASYFAPIDPIAAFFGGAFLLLAGALAGLSWILTRTTHSQSIVAPGMFAVAKLGIRNASRNPTRSVLTASLIGFAVFIIVAIGLMRHHPENAPPRKESSNGGFSLIAESASPIFRDLNDPNGKAELGFQPSEEKLLEGTQFYSFRMRPGDDASCLNIYRPTNPTLLGVPMSMRKRGGFEFASLLKDALDDEKANPWRLLNRRFRDGALPAIADSNTLQWILKKNIGDTITILSEYRPQSKEVREVKVRFVATMPSSLFQGELLIAEEHMMKYFPESSGTRVHLIETPPGKEQEVRKVLSTTLSRYGFSVETTAARIASFKIVENTYMAAFQTLGGLGLALGTIGLAVVLARNVLERRGELALLRALGFRRRQLSWLVLAETAFLLFAGLVIGILCGSIAVSPQLSGLHSFGPILELLAFVMIVIVVGLLSGVIGVILAFRTPLLTALRSE